MVDPDGTCHATVPVDEYGHSASEPHVLACWLPDGHGGLHYDEVDNIAWQEGKPDGL